MATPPIIAVVGATGAQGGGLVRAILSDPARRFRVRALTRNPRSVPARALGTGVEVVQASLDDAGSLMRAFEGVHGVFGITNYWEHHSPERELRQAQALAAAAVAADVQHLVWSTLEDTRRWLPVGSGHMPVLRDQYNVPHMDAKGEADKVFAMAGVPTTWLRTSFYWDNLIHLGMAPRRGVDGGLVFALPLGDKPLPGIAAADIGACALGLFADGARHIGRTVGIAGEHLTGRQMADALSDAVAEPVRYEAVPFDTYRGLGFPGADDLGNMFQFKHDFNADYCGARSPALTRELHPGVQSFAQWLARHRAALLLA
ncbi:MAG: NmrA/HSCARG family protein [Rhizobacter sp.]|nr:NmrA/HSCARG family protein [Rhizobacter sp.]